MDPARCVLESFFFTVDKVELRFLNGSVAFLKAKNPEGEQEILNIGKRLNEFAGKSYKDILEAEF